MDKGGIVVKSWYSRSNDIELKNGDVRREYHLVFETDNIEIKEKIEAFFKKLMDEKTELPEQNIASIVQSVAQDATMPLMREQIKSPLSPFAYKDELIKALQEAHFGYDNGFMYGA